MELLQDATVWLLLSFAIFMFILVRMGKAGFLAMLDSRIEGIKNDIKTAENLRIEAQEMLAQYQRKHRDAVKESEEIIANAKKRATEITKQAEKDLDELTKRREKQLKDRLVRMEQTAISEIQTYAAELAVEATKEIIANDLDKKNNERLVNESIKSLAGNL